MGVPKFYRWISERYPCLSEVVKEYQIPEFDNLYLDMNGIIHLCSHPNDDDPHFRITEEQIYSGIFHYIECLFRLIKPRKVFFMAVDGVAPRAKMNQQRARRFRSAREAVDLEKRAVGRGEELPKEKRFDSNCITPGTEFMARLHEQLKYFVNFKISTDKMWQGLRIYLSGQETPGEGEHKIMDFIRYEKTQPGYDPNTRHCLYGLDADLIMLGMCTHEPHFSLLREEVRFTGKKSKRIPTPEETTFHLLHLSLLREYLEHEFSPIRDKLPFPFDVEKIVDDWVMMGFLVGNDFIPNLPHLHIVHGALPTLYKTYCDVLPMLDGYINEGGFLNLPRFEKYIERLAQLEYEHFTENTYADLKWLESKKVKTASPEKQRSRSRNKEKDIGGKNQFKVLDGLEMDDFQETDGQEVPVGVLISLSDDDDLEEEEDEDDDDLRELEFGNYKRNYYMDKMAYEQVTPEVLRGQAECFVEAIQWNLHYYYHGVCSWSWYYPHHYAPYISDIKNFSHLKLEFDLGTPFLPFEQLLAVLPAASKFLLPKPYHDLMCNKDSPLVDYYPEDFRTDLNGKQQDWEAVVLIPFIDEERLLNAMRPKNDLLKEEEKNRNRHGPCLLYTYSEKPRGKYPSLSPGRFPDIVINFARCTEIAIEGFAVSRDRLVKGLSKDVRLDVYFPGFPTLKHIPHTAMLKKAEVRVFQGNSRGDNMILTINSQLTLGLFKAAEQYLNKTVFVSWPHLIEAKVISVSNAQCKCRLIEKNGENGPNESRISEEEMSKDKANVWKMEKNSIIEMYKKRWGVEIGETTILIHATPLIGRKYLFCNGGKMTLQKQWSSLAIPYAIQMVVTDIKVQDPSFRQYLTMEEVFKPKTICFMLGTPHYGCMGEVLTCTSKKKDLISVQFEVIPDVDIDQIRFRHESAGDEYFLGCIAAQRLGISGHLFSCITTTLYATLGSKLHPGSSRVNLGLCLKFNKKSEEVPGYTKRSQGTWLYSAKTIEVVNSYLSKFPEMFDYLSKHLQDGNYFVDDMLAQCPPGITLNEIKNFLKSLPSQQVGRQHCGSEIVEKDVITEIEQIIDDYHARMQKKSVVLMVQPHHLYLPGNFQGSSSPDPTTKFYLLDRVVNIREGYTVPLGYRGTIISVQAADKDADVIYEILFDKEFCGGLTLRCSPNRGYRLPAYALINFTHHERQQSHHRQKPMAVVHPRSAKANEHDLYPIMTQSNSKRSKLDRTSSKSAPNSVEGRTATKQACGPSPRHSNAPNTLNHSPNSPFIAKQQRHPLNQSQAPHFVTPKMSTSPQMPSTSWQLMAHQQQVQRLQGPAQQIQSDNEFQNMWKELAAKSSPDLVQAAKSLPKQHQSLPPRRSWNRIIALDKPEVVHQGGPPPMPAFGTKAVGEYSQMLHALESQSKIQESQEPPFDVNSKNSNADLNNLLQQLKLAHPEEKRTTASTIKMSSTKPDSRQLTVQQLFKDARDPLLPDPPKKLEVTSPEIQDARQLKRGKPESGSYVMNLMNIIQARYNTMPLYEYLTVGPSQMISARVKLPDDRFFNGGIAATKEEAAEWAAQCALAEIMTAPSFGKPSGTHHATLNPSAVAHHMTGMPMQMNAVYPPVIVPSGLPHPMHPLSAGPYTPYHQGNMAPVYQIRHPYHPYPHAYAGAPQIQPHMRWPVQGVWQADRQSEWASTRSGPNFQYDQSNICRTNNAFIPLQVIKQNVTPKRTTSISRPLDDGDMVVINAPSSQHNVVNPRVTHIASSSSGGGYQKPASGMPPQNLTQREKGQALDHQNKPSKRPRSRLAIRFDGRQT